MKIAVIDDYQQAFHTLACYQRLQDHEVIPFREPEQDPVRFAARLSGMDALILTQQRSALPRAIIEKLPASLKIIAQTGHNTKHIDVAACTERGIIVAAKYSSIPYATAELAWALILSALRHIPQEVEQLKKGVWQTTLGTGLHGKTLGIYAFGRIGRLVAEVGRAFGMKVVGFGREGSLVRAREAGCEAASSRAAFFASMDVLSIHIPLNAATRGIITADDLARMKPTALLVNTSRAPIIAEGALLAALKSGRPGFAAVDVYEEEPVTGGNHQLLKLPNVLCTPHLGYVERGTLESYYNPAIDSLLAYAAGQPINVVNPDVLKKKSSGPLG